MACLILPVSILRRGCGSASRLGYRRLDDDVYGDSDGPVTVVVGKEKREFLVDRFVLEENPFRLLMDMVRKGNKGGADARRGEKRVIFVDVDAILFEHMLWLMQNDCSSLFKLNLKEIIDFYAQDF
ncbi:hypothetical protein RJ640_029804 [Escallonia rubra]|uniref:Uncharacterized protein n=1 Tax=Escallonia rubra TaxID=112253 RepID=A0AA88S4K4_9ASTE|nr:hypothetical protein RJ640_029804 [Escallonia rubra]